MTRDHGRIMDAGGDFEVAKSAMASFALHTKIFMVKSGFITSGLFNASVSTTFICLKIILERPIK